MGKKLYEESNIQAIAEAIREKNGSTVTYKTSEMPLAIQAMETGIDTTLESGGATEIDMAEDTKAYVNGELVTGTVDTITGNLNVYATNITHTDGAIYLVAGHPFSDPCLFRANSRLNMRCNLSNFGDATAQDVAFGKTFTSTAGFKVTGTASTSAGNYASGNTSLYSGKVSFSLSFTPRVISIFCAASFGGGAYSVNVSKGGYYIGGQYGTITYAISGTTVTLTLATNAATSINGMPITWYAC